MRRYFLPVRGSCTKTEVTCTTGFQKIMNANLAAEIGNQSMNGIVEALPFLSQCMLYCYFKHNLLAISYFKIQTLEVSSVFAENFIQVAFPVFLS